MKNFNNLTIRLKNEKGEDEIFEINYDDLVGEHLAGPDFGELVKKIRKEKKMTQEQLSELSGVGMNSISGIETGQRNITEQMMKRITDALGVELIFTLKQKK